MQTYGIEYQKVSQDGYSHMIFGKGGKTFTEEKTASSTNGAGKNGYSHVED
jgi:hypothetical protein